MKDLYMKYPLNIQLFGDDNGDSGQTEGQGNSENTEQSGQEAESFTQADIDRAVTKAVQTATTKNEAAVAKAVADAIAEERRQATLTEEQRKVEAQEQAQQALEDKQAELDRRLLRLDVGESLAAESLSQEFLDFVVGTDLEDSKKKIATLKKIVDKQVEDGIKGIVSKPGVPSKQSGKVLTLTKEQIMGIKDDAERQKQIALHPELFTYK